MKTEHRSHVDVYGYRVSLSPVVQRLQWQRILQVTNPTCIHTLPTGLLQLCKKITTARTDWRPVHSVTVSVDCRISGDTIR